MVLSRPYSQSGCGCSLARDFLSHPVRQGALTWHGTASKTMNDAADETGNMLLQQLLTHRSEIFAFIRSLVRNTHDAEDLFQEVALVVVRTGAQREADIGNFRAWAKTVALHKVQRFFRERQKARSRQLPVQEMVELAEEAFRDHSPPVHELEGQQEALRNCMEQLPEPLRDAIRLRFSEDREYQEIAGVLSRTEAATRRLVARTRLVLLNCMQGRLADAVWKQGGA